MGNNTEKNRPHAFPAQTPRTGEQTIPSTAQYWTDDTISESGDLYPKSHLKRKYAQSSIQEADDIEDGRADNLRRTKFTPSKSLAVTRAIQNEWQQEQEVSPEKDWRQILCSSLGVSGEITDNDLEFSLKEALDAQESDACSNLAPVLTPFRPEPYYKVLHRVKCYSACNIYNDKPFISKNDNTLKGSHLVGVNQVSSMDRFMERNIGISFVVIHEYSCCNSNRYIYPRDRQIPSNETLRFGSSDLCSELERLQSFVANGAQVFPKFTTETEYNELHLGFYRYQKELTRLLEGAAAGETKKHLICFLDYIRQHKLDEFREVDMLLQQGNITRRLLPYLYVPGDVYVLTHHGGTGFFRGVRLASWPTVTTTWGKDQWLIGNHMDDMSITISLDFKTSAWEFDGTFKHCQSKTATTIKLELDDSISLTTLKLLPHRLLGEEIQRFLFERGQMFWSCRSYKYVSYNGWDSHTREKFNNSRFMVDTRAYNAFSNDQKATTKAAPEGFIEELSQELMECEKPPENDFILLLPLWMHGFSIDDKRWRNLLVSNMRKVVWDDNAFLNLVLPTDTKDVIKALVTHRVSTSLSTDLIRGKGSGLILLLHGPPGTGKTLTAESVAEHAKKPLYRVTCGDIGTKPEAVERYLGSTLRLAKAWGCVVLLDEAEIFLQERSLTDLDRNALVSVFLRALEYYDGILILTSNRVGTLDEGFKSRIQLALEYSKLGNDARRRVWENFINSLEKDPEALTEIDIPDLRRNLSDLSQHELNGREIRNAINVARPLALSTGTQVDFKCLKKVINVQQRFGKYIKDLNEGLDDEKLARELGTR